MAKKKKGIKRGKFWLIAIIIFILLFSVIGVAVIYIAPDGAGTTQPAFEEIVPEQELMPQEPDETLGLTGDNADGETDAPAEEQGEMQEVDVSSEGEAEVEVNFVE